MFSQTTEYALRVVVHLATLDKIPATTRQIAGITRIPLGYLSKVLQALSRAGIVSSQRGLHGGSVLAVSPETLSIFDVIQAVCPIQRIRTCPLGIPAHGNQLCALHRRLDGAVESVETLLRRALIADLLRERNDSMPLCDTCVGSTEARLAAVPQKT